MFEKKEVEKIARLARLELSDEEIKKMQKELGSILDYVELLEKLNVQDVKPTFHSIPLQNVMREDKPFQTKGQGGFVKVKEVL